MTIKFNVYTDTITHTSVCGGYHYNVSEDKNTVLFLDLETETWCESRMEAQWLVEII